MIRAVATLQRFNRHLIQRWQLSA